MNKIKIDEDIEGMELAEPVINKFGQTLIPPGTKLTKRHINLLMMWGIDSISILDSEKLENETSKINLSEETLRFIDEQLSKRFLWEPENEYEKEIYDMAYRKMAKDLSGKK